MNKADNSEIRLKLLKLLEKEPELTQREMNKKMGVSLGKINYCISALADKGMIRIERFKKHPKKSAYIYRLTPQGFEELTRLTVTFLKIRLAEYEQIKSEIKALSIQIEKLAPNMKCDTTLVKELKKIV